MHCQGQGSHMYKEQIGRDWSAWDNSPCSTEHILLVFVMSSDSDSDSDRFIRHKQFTLHEQYRYSYDNIIAMY